MLQHFIFSCEIIIVNVGIFLKDFILCELNGSGDACDPIHGGDPVVSVHLKDVVELGQGLLLTACLP